MLRRALHPGGGGADHPCPEAGTDRLGVPEITREMLEYLDVLVDGEFVLEKKDITLQFRGSSNQRLIDVPKTLEAGRVVWWDGK